MSKSCCSKKDPDQNVNVNVNVTVDVPKIVKYSYVMGFLLVGFFFVAKNLKNLLETVHAAK
jgi:hypothetical protein